MYPKPSSVNKLALHHIIKIVTDLPGDVGESGDDDRVIVLHFEHLTLRVNYAEGRTQYGRTGAPTRTLITR